MLGFRINGAMGLCVLQTVPLYLPPKTRGPGPVRACIVPYCVSWLWLLPAAVQKVGLSL